MTPSGRSRCATTRPGLRKILAHTACSLIAAAALLTSALPHNARAGEIPRFEVDPSWPKPLPNNWILGQVGGITVDSEGHIWLIHRPRSLTDDEKGRGA